MLQQITPLHCTREHLPQDIIQILECLGKVVSTPFDKLYYLTENCADHYYTKVIQTYFTARALKYLEAYGQRQAQLFTVLEKYHQVPDGLEDLKSQFHFLKEETSKNIGNLQQAINLQQTYSAALCGHVNVIFTRLAKLETQIQNISDRIKMDQNEVQ